MPIPGPTDKTATAATEPLPDMKVEIIEYGQGPVGAIDNDDLVRITWDGPVYGHTLEPIQMSAEAFVASTQEGVVWSPFSRASFLEMYATRRTDGSRLPIAASLDAFVSALPVPEPKNFFDGLFTRDENELALNLE